MTNSNEFENLCENYAIALLRINDYIERNSLDYDKVWDKANQHYDKIIGKGKSLTEDK